MKKQSYKILWIFGYFFLNALSSLAQPIPTPSAVQQSTGINGAVTAMTVYNDKLIIAGSFTQADGIPCDGLIVWDGTSYDTLPGTPAFGTTISNSIYAMLQYGNSLYVGGKFQALTTNLGSISFGNIIRYNGAGQWLQLGTNTSHPAFAATNGPVRSLHNHDGELFIGGDFTMVDINGSNISAGHIATFDINTKGWDSVGLGSMGLKGNSATVHAMTSYKNQASINAQLVIAGRFENADNTTSRNVVIWDKVLGYNTINTGSFTSQIGSVHCIDTIGGKLYAGGDYNNIGMNNYFGLNAYDGSVWTSLNANIGIDRRVLFSCNNDYIWVGGNIADLGSPKIQNVFIYDVAKDSVIPFSNTYTGVDGIVNAMTEYKGELYIAGDFNNLLGNGTSSNIAYNNIFKVSGYCNNNTTTVNEVKSKTDIQIFPNPIKNLINITNIPSGSKLKIMSIEGKLAYNSFTENEQTTINTSDFTNGIYILQIENNIEIVSRKIVVNK